MSLIPALRKCRKKDHAFKASLGYITKSCLKKNYKKNLAGRQWLQPVILRRQRSGGSQFKASPGKQITRPYLEKAHHKNRAGGVAQDVGTEFKPSTNK
jgi:hypothetical protein